MIRRSEHSADKKFTIISRAVAQDSSLSFQARGLLLYVLSKPGNWSAKDADLMRAGGVGEKALASIIRELKTAGYIRRTRKQKPGTGQFYFLTEVFEEPEFESLEPHPPNGGTAPYPLEPRTDNGGTAIDSTGARAGSSVDLTRSKEITPSGYKVTPKEPEPKTLHPPEDFQIQEWMRTYLAERFIEFTEDELDELTDSWRLARKADSEKRRTLDQWCHDWLRYVCATWQNRKTNGHKREEEGWDYHSALVAPEKPVDYFEKIWNEANGK